MLFKVKVRYNIPKIVNGWNIEEEIFTFNTEQDRTNFLNGEAAYDYLDYWVKLDTNKYTVVEIYTDSKDKEK